MKRWILPVIGIMTLSSCNYDQAPARVSVLDMHRATLTEQGFCARQAGPDLSSTGKVLPIELIFPEPEDEEQVLVHAQSASTRQYPTGQGKVIRQ